MEKNIYKEDVVEYVCSVLLLCTVYFVAFIFITSDDLTKSLLLIFINLQQYTIHYLQIIIMIVILQSAVCDWLLAMACWWMACICAVTLA